jgi:hypothetical protein
LPTDDDGIAESAMGPLERSAAQNERNALSFGWHVGYYSFVLVSASKETNAEPARPLLQVFLRLLAAHKEPSLDAQTQQVFSIVQPRLIELSRYFGVSAEFELPSSPREARRLRDNLEAFQQISSGASIAEKLTIDFDTRVASFYGLGNKIITYALVRGRAEPEVIAVSSSLRRDIEDLSTRLGIETTAIERILSDEEATS